MNRIFSIASVTLRTAIRSRLVVFLFLFLLLILIGLPLTIEGDGTLVGYVKILLSYTLGFTGLILAVVSVWVGCSAVSSEIQSHQMDLIVTKPVSSIQIWYGKWLGLVTLNFILLVFTYSVAYGSLRWAVAHHAEEDELRRLNEEILVSREILRPEDEGIVEEAEDLFRLHQEEGVIPESITSEKARELIARDLQLKANSIPVGYSARWVYKTGAASSERPLFVRYTFSASRQPIKGMWIAGSHENNKHAEMRALDRPGFVYALRIDSGLIDEDGRLTLEYENINDVPSTVIFPPEDQPVLLKYHDAFEMNYLRVFLMTFIRLAMLGAIGLTAGTLFSQPVALFMSGWVVLLLTTGNYIKTMSQADSIFIGHHHDPARIPGLIDRIFHYFFLGLNRIVEPLQTPAVLESLSRGEWVSWSLTGVEFIFKIVFMCGVLALASSWILNRREVGLPT